MNMRRFAGILSAVLLIGLVQAPLLLGDEGVARERDLTRIRKKVEALRAWQLTEELDLDEETSSRLFPAMNEVDQERWAIEASNRKLMRTMSRSLEGSNPDPESINGILDELMANKRELNRVEEKHIERVRQILSPADTARYLLFQIRFQREIKKKAAEAYRGRRPPDSTYEDRNRSDDDGGAGGDGGGSSSGGGSHRGKK